MIFLILAFTIGVTYITVAKDPVPVKEHKTTEGGNRK